MLTKLVADDYLRISPKGVRSLSEAFYQLSLADKYEVVRLFNEQGLLSDYRLYNKLVKGILQHSPAQTRREYPVRGVRWPHRKAIQADEVEAMQALAVNFDALVDEIAAYAAANLTKIARAANG